MHVAELVAVRAANRAVAIACEVPAKLPPVLGNIDKLEQVLLNLCKNAIEAMHGGGQLRIEARAEAQHVHIDVSDDGPGIPTSLDVFAPFSTTKAAGMGLGLPIAREIVAAHGGTLSYASAPQRGTTFTISLPRQ